MTRTIRKNLGPFAAILLLIALAAVIGAYILDQERFRFPLAESKPFRVNVEFDNAQAVTPGQGQTAQVAGVRIGDIAEVRLRNGRAIVGLDIEPRYADLIRRDARAQLRPRTGLKDMYVQIFPGREGPPVKEGFTIAQSRSLTDVDLDEILSELDARTRDYVTLLANGAGEGLREPRRRPRARARALRADDPRPVARQPRGRARSASRCAGSSPRSRRSTARSRASPRTSRASCAPPSRRSARSPPRTTRCATRPASSPRRSSRRRRRCAPCSRSPSSSGRRRARCCRPCGSSRTSTPRSARSPARRRRSCATRSGRSPAARSRSRATSRPAARGLARTFPELDRDLKVLNDLGNMLGHNPGGREDPGKAGREEGYLFWLAWSSHQGANLQSIDDANGPMRPFFLTATCKTFTSLVNDQPQLEFALGLSPLLATVCNNPTTTSLSVTKSLARLGVKR